MEINRSKVMGIISLASGSSCWRGLDYFKGKKVVELNKINENEYSSIVKGTNNYNVHLDIEHLIFQMRQLVLKKNKIAYEKSMKKSKKRNMIKQLNT